MEDEKKILASSSAVADEVALTGLWIGLLLCPGIRGCGKRGDQRWGAAERAGRPHKGKRHVVWVSRGCHMLCHVLLTGRLFCIPGGGLSLHEMSVRSQEKRISVEMRW
jgi:hypothetical protein